MDKVIPVVVIKDISKLLIFKISNDSQSLNIPYIFFTLDVLKLLKSNSVNDSQALNKLPIFVTLDVSQLAVSTLTNALQLLNIETILVKWVVPDTYKTFFKAVFSLLLEKLILVGKLVMSS